MGSKKHIVIHADQLDKFLEETCSTEKALKIFQELQENYRVKLKWITETLKVRCEMIEGDIDITVSISTKGDVDPGKALAAVVIEMHNQIEATEESVKRALEQRKAEKAKKAANPVKVTTAGELRKSIENLSDDAPLEVSVNRLSELLSKVTPNNKHDAVDL